MTVWQRTLKIALATVIAIWIADLLSLQNTTAAGIIAILTLLDTRKASLEKGYIHIAATLIAFTISSILFYFFGFHVWVLGIYLLIFVPITYKFGLQSAIAPVSVMVTHFYIAESISWQWQYNGIMIILIGVVVALLTNTWMPSNSRNIETIREKVEKTMQDILCEMGESLTTRVTSADKLKNQLGTLSDLLAKMNEEALFQYENGVFEDRTYNLNYVTMRKNQLTLLNQMSQALPQIHLSTKQNKILSQMFLQTADELDEKNTGYALLNNIAELFTVFRGQELPKSRQEFETRAVLYQLLLYFERFLEIKHDFYHDHQIDHYKSDVK